MNLKKLTITQLPAPYEYAISIIGGKWHSRILNALHSFKGMHYAELHKALNPISDTVLSATLREFLKEGIIEKTEDERASVVYKLTQKGEELIPIFRSLSRWTKNWKTTDSSLADAGHPSSKPIRTQSKEEVFN